MKNFSLILLSILTLFACKKEETKKSVLIEELAKSEWRKTSILVSADSVAPDTIPTISLASLSCNADNVWHFNATTNTFILDEGATKCDGANPQIKDQGVITDLNDGSQLRVEGSGTNEIWNIESRSASSFRVSYFARVSSQTRKFRVTFTKI
jgi:hypothetical protein